MATNIHKMDTWNLIWIVVCSDTIIKFMVICIKACVTLVPLTTIPLRRRVRTWTTRSRCCKNIDLGNPHRLCVRGRIRTCSGL